MAFATRTQLGQPTCRILDAMAWLESGRIPMPWPRSLVAYASDHLPLAGGFRAYVANLKGLGLISYLDGRLVLEHDGRQLAVEDEDGFALVAYWARLEGKLGPVERSICRILRERGDFEVRFEVARFDLARAVGLDQRQLAFRNATSKLLAVELIDVRSDHYFATESLRPRNVFERRAEA
jgi:hypothetical protein